jgi:toxin-antitoxin system PIN domain toxin
MTTLLDVNVLIALLDQNHVHHDAATCFLQNVAPDGWATCPLTENGVLRILGRPIAQGGVGSPEAVRSLLNAWCGYRGHQFWADDVSLLRRDLFQTLPDPKHLTDIYLLGLAVKHGGRLATFDTKLDASIVAGGAAAYLCLTPTESKD